MIQSQNQNRCWFPNPGPQADFLHRREFEVFYGGAKGGGKTDVLIVDQMSGICHPGYVGLITRRTFPELRECIERSHRFYQAIVTQDGKIVRGAWNGSEKVWRFNTGARIEFGSMVHEDSKQHYQGREFTRISFDQLEQFTETQYMFMMGQVRTPIPELLPHLGVRATGNPGGPGHAWNKARFIDSKIPYKTYMTKYTLPDGREVELSNVFIPAKVYDNPKLTENNPQYVAVLMSLPQDLREAWLNGNYDIFVGQFFSEFLTDIHGVDPFVIPDDWEIYGAMDYGEANPTSFGLYAISPLNVIYRIAEYYSPGVRNDHIREIHKLIGECRWTKHKRPKRIFASHEMWIARSRDSGARKSDAMDFLDSGLPLTKATTDRVNGWHECKDRLHWDMDDNGEWILKPTFYYFKGECSNFKRTIPNCIFKQKPDGSPAEDMEKTGEDHAADEFRYLVMGIRQPAGKQPEEVETTWDIHRKGHMENWERMKRPRHDEYDIRNILR